MSVEPEQVAQLRVPLVSGKHGIGSGYLVAPRLLLTAAHVVQGEDVAADVGVEVTVPAQGVQRIGTVRWCGAAAGLDVALVELEQPVGPLRAPVRWGRLTGRQPSVRAEAMGFPRALVEAQNEHAQPHHRARTDVPYRTVEHVSGQVNPGVGFGSRYDLTLDGTHPLAEVSDASPWSGLSGSALHCGRLLAGVVVLDVPTFQSGRLSAVPAWRLLADPGFAGLLAAHGCAQHWESVELHELLHDPSGQGDSPASLLRADAAVVRFRGRAELLEQLTDWCVVEPCGSVAGAALLTGQGGQGKTRLAWQLCHQLRSAGWVTGFVRDQAPAALLRRVADTGCLMLLVVDYAETRAGQVEQLARVAVDATRPVRLLLLARSAGEWWRQLRSELRRTVGTAWQVALTSLEDSLAGRQQAYTEAVADLAAELPRLRQWRDIDWAARAQNLDVPDLTATAFGSVLTLHLHALTALLTAEDSARRPPNPDDLEELLLEHEADYWNDLAERRRLQEPAFQPSTLRRAAGVATLCGAATEQIAIATVARLPGLRDKSEDEQLGVARWIADLYPGGEAQYWGSLQPDRIGEHLVGQVAHEWPDCVAVAFDGATPDQQYRALTVLSRAAAHQPHLENQFLALLRDDLVPRMHLVFRVASQAPQPDVLVSAAAEAVRCGDLDLTTLVALANALPPASRSLAPLALAIMAALRSRAADADLDVDARRSLEAMCLSHYCLWLIQEDRMAEAVGAAEAAVTLAIELHNSSPARFSFLLGLALNNFGVALHAHDQEQRARLVLAEADRVMEYADSQQFYGYPAAAEDGYLQGVYSPERATSLTSLATVLHQAGDHQQAYIKLRTALPIHSAMSQVDFDRFGPALAHALNLQSSVVRKLGLPNDALPIAADAVNQWRRLADKHHRRHLAALADALDALANLHGDLVAGEGQQPPSDDAHALAAVGAAIESAELHRTWAESQHDTESPGLARSLHNLAGRLAHVGRRDEARAAIDEAVRLRASLRERNPEKSTGKLAESLWVRSKHACDCGRHESALDDAGQALALRRTVGSDAERDVMGLRHFLRRRGACLLVASAEARRQGRLDVAAPLEREYAELEAEDAALD